MSERAEAIHQDERRGKPRRRRRLLRLLVVAVVTLLALLATEGVLRLRKLRQTPRRDRDAWHRFDPLLGWRAKADYSGKGSTPGPEPIPFTVRTNPQGWRSDRPYAPRPPRGTKRICLIGDSFVFGYGCEVEESCPLLLDRRLGPGVEVLNLGTCAYGVDQMRLVVEHEALPLEPDLIIVGVIGQNFRRALRAVSITGQRKPRFLLEGERVRLADPPLPSPPEEGEWSYSDLPPEGGSFLLWQLGVLWGRARVALAGGAEAARPRWRLGRALLLDARRLAEARGIPLAVALFPTPKSLARGDPLRELLSGLDADLPFCDVSPLFEREADPGPLFLPDGHPSPRGQALMAEALAAFIRERGWL